MVKTAATKPKTGNIGDRLFYSVPIFKHKLKEFTSCEILISCYSVGRYSSRLVFRMYFSAFVYFLPMLSIA